MEAYLEEEELEGDAIIDFSDSPDTSDAEKQSKPLPKVSKPSTIKSSPLGNKKNVKLEPLIAKNDRIDQCKSKTDTSDPSKHTKAVVAPSVTKTDVEDTSKADCVYTPAQLRQLDYALVEEIMSETKKQMLPALGDCFEVTVAPVELLDLAHSDSLQALIEKYPSIAFFFRRQGKVKFKKKKGHAQVYFNSRQDVEKFIAQLFHLQVAERNIEVTVNAILNNVNPSFNLSFVLCLRKSDKVVRLLKTEKDSFKYVKATPEASLQIEKVPKESSFVILRLIFPFSTSVKYADNQNEKLDAAFSGPVNVFFNNKQWRDVVLECCSDFRLNDTKLTIVDDTPVLERIISPVKTEHKRRASQLDDESSNMFSPTQSKRSRHSSSQDQDDKDDAISNMTLDVCAGMMESLMKLKQMGTDNPNVLKILEMQSQLEGLQNSLIKKKSHSSQDSSDPWVVGPSDTCDDDSVSGPAVANKSVKEDSTADIKSSSKDNDTNKSLEGRNSDESMSAVPQRSIEERERILKEHIAIAKQKIEEIEANRVASLSKEGDKSKESRTKTTTGVSNASHKQASHQQGGQKGKKKSKKVAQKPSIKQEPVDNSGEFGSVAIKQEVTELAAPQQDTNTSGNTVESVYGSSGHGTSGSAHNLSLSDSFSAPSIEKETSNRRENNEGEADTSSASLDQSTVRGLGAQTFEKAFFPRTSFVHNFPELLGSSTGSKSSSSSSATFSFSTTPQTEPSITAPFAQSTPMSKSSTPFSSLPQSGGLKFNVSTTPQSESSSSSPFAHSTPISKRSTSPSFNIGGDVRSFWPMSESSKSKSLPHSSSISRKPTTSSLIPKPDVHPLMSKALFPPSSVSLPGPEFKINTDRSPHAPSMDKGDGALLSRLEEFEKELTKKGVVTPPKKTMGDDRVHFRVSPDRSMFQGCPVYTEKEHHLRNKNGKLPQEYYIQTMFLPNRRCPVLGCPASKAFKTEPMFLEHWNMFHKPTVTMRFCPRCSAYFIHSEELHAHLQRTHMVNPSIAFPMVDNARVKIVSNPSYRDPGKFLNPPV